MERDPELGALLAKVSGEAPVEDVDWEQLRRRIEGSTALLILSARRARRRMRAFIGTAMAASVALLFMVTRSGDVGSGEGALGANPTTEEILASDVSDDELRALLAGAGDVEALLLLAASESEL